MLQSPFALIGLLGLIVPLLIHLWERREGRRVLVGSIRWLKESEDLRVSRLKFTDLWRFLLRALIVILFVLLIGRPVWRSVEADEKAKHWVLVEPAEKTDDALAETLDSLQARGRPVRYLAVGFPEWISGEEPVSIDSTINYWSLLHRLSRERKSPDTVTILAHPKLRHFAGERPRLPFVVKWRSIPEKEASSSFLVAAWKKGEVVTLLLGTGAPEGLYLHRATAPATAGHHELPPPYSTLILQTGVAPALWQARLSGSDRPAIPVSELPQRTIRIYYDAERNEEQQYLRAALRAVAVYTGFPVESREIPVSAFELPETEAPDQEWLFWLSEQPLPEGLRPIYSPRLVQQDTSGYYEPSYFKPADFGYSLCRPLRPTNYSASIGDQLPAELIRLLFENAVKIPAEYDQRQIDFSQLQPKVKSVVEKSNYKQSDRHFLHFPLWLLLCGLFLVERALAKRR